METTYIFTPGPVKMSEETLRIGAIQTPYFRNESFSEVLKQCEKDLLILANAPQGSRVVFLSASGTGAMEAAVMNLMGASNQAVVINGGTFGERFAQLCERYDKSWSEHRVHLNNLSNTDELKEYAGDTLLINAHETSVGILYDLDAIGTFCRNKGWLNIVDAISMFVTDPLDMIRQNIDALILSSHKGLALPPGLSMVVLSPRAIARLQPVQSVYFDFNAYLSDGLRGQTPFTPPVTIILQLQARLAQIRHNGIYTEYAKARKNAEYFRGSISALPLKFYSDFMPNAMTTLSPIDDRSAYTIVEDLKKYYNIAVAPNGGELHNTVFRVAHMGAITIEYTDILINALFNYYGVKR